MHDYYTGLDMDSFQVVADFALDGVAAGENLAPKFKAKSPGVWELTLARPLTRAAQRQADGLREGPPGQRHPDRADVCRRDARGESTLILGRLEVGPSEPPST